MRRGELTLLGAHYRDRVGAALEQGGVKLLAKQAFWWGARKLGYNSQFIRRRAMIVDELNLKLDASLVVDGLIRAPQFASPEISIIIPTYGQVQHTLACVASITAAPPVAPFEIIVIDDAFPGKDALRLGSGMEGVTVLRNAENLGFIRSCNLGAATAKGAYLFFLNNDTKVLPGAIDALHHRLVGNPDIGLAGSKLVYPDGRLQEAGGIIWSDGSGWNYGRGDSPYKPEYCYFKDADYISGAAIMLQKSTFVALGGFDLAFLPAYCEDVDLAMKIRATGQRVVMEPRSIVVHFEGVSNGTDTSGGVKAYQIANTQKLREIWAATLARDHYASPAFLALARDQRKGSPRILVIDHYVPQPDRDAGSRAMMHMLNTLIKAGWVVKFWPNDRQYSHVYTPGLQDLGIEVLDFRSGHSLASWLGKFGASLDHVLISRPTVAADVLDSVRKRITAPISYYGHDLHFRRMQRQATETGNKALAGQAERMKAQELAIWGKVGAVMYPSEVEASVVRDMAPGSLARAIPLYCFDEFKPRAAAATGKNVLFVAGFAHPPNIDAALLLINKIAPLVWAHDPDVRFTLAGSSPTQVVQAMASEQVTVTGWISDDDLADLYRMARVAIVPLTYGAGVKGKVVEALALGLPLVTTPVGAEGIPGVEAVACVSETPAGLAAGIIQLLEDDALWLGRSNAALAYAQQHFSPQTMADALLNTLASNTQRNA